MNSTHSLFVLLLSMHSCSAFRQLVGPSRLDPKKNPNTINQQKVFRAKQNESSPRRTLRLIYPLNPLEPKQADGPYKDELCLAQEKGIDCSLFDFDEFVSGGPFRANPKLGPEESVLYRGWMMTPEMYARFCRQIENRGVQPITSETDYARCHWLPGWYDACADVTAETHLFEPDEEDIVAKAAALSWDGFFVKDFVKSNSGTEGSIAQRPGDIPKILDELKLYRGDLEGGIALRKLEKYIEGSEQRYFVVNQKAYGASDNLPSIVQTVADRVQAPFFSVDVAQTAQGDWRVVELGDGQVSEKKEWPLERFVNLFSAIETE